MTEFLKEKGEEYPPLVFSFVYGKTLILWIEINKIHTNCGFQSTICMCFYNLDKVFIFLPSRSKM